jgi:hypothetical protein
MGKVMDKTEHMKMQTKLEYRMYGLVPYNLSPIQQGIQFGHAVQEYNNIVFEWLAEQELTHSVERHEELNSLIDPFKKWAYDDKTFIILNGGTTNFSTGKNRGTLNLALDELENLEIMFSRFYEPHLGDQLTAVVFLLDERIWDKKKYPDKFGNIAPRKGLELGAAMIPESDEDYAERLGGEQNVKLREFLSKFRLA